MDDVIEEKNRDEEEELKILASGCIQKESYLILGALAIDSPWYLLISVLISNSYCQQTPQSCCMFTLAVIWTLVV
ncbi:hypothetical protein L1887_23387 [Cichorium endivia]|nr:hypothetical protein L1887_23387 [Cichorium endivia]